MTDRSPHVSAPADHATGRSVKGIVAGGEWPRRRSDGRRDRGLRPGRRAATWLAAAGFGALAAALIVGWSLGRPNAVRGLLLAAYAVQWLAFAAAAAAVRRVPAQSAVRWILVGGAVLQVLAVLWPPRATDDFYRYIWDGRVQAAGIDPYRYPPTDPHLAALRDNYLFPGGHPALNHPGAHTIYPPVAQAYFLLLHYLPGEHARPLQLVSALLAVGTAALLVRLLRRTGRDPRAVVLWAWCPTVVLEAGNDAHVDVLGVACLVAALTALAMPPTPAAPSPATPSPLGPSPPPKSPETPSPEAEPPPTTQPAGAVPGRRGAIAAAIPNRRRTVVAGALLGAAIGVKFLPALAVPALARHPRRWLLAAAATGLLAVAYLPHLVAVGPAALGFLGGYLQEEQFAGSARYPLLGLLPRTLVPAEAVPLLAALLIAGTAAAAALRADPQRPAAGAAAIVGVAFCVTAPEYPWYALLLVALLAAADQPRWLPVAAAAWPAYLAGALRWQHTPTRATAYALAALAVVIMTAPALRRRTATGTSARWVPSRR